jgi:hypothetical protein
LSWNSFTAFIYGAAYHRVLMVSNAIFVLGPPNAWARP